MKLAGKAALITGAGQGIGRATALAFARGGADIVVDDMNFDTARRVAEEVQALGRDALGVKANVASPYEVEYLVEVALEKFKKIDILVNNAAIITVIPFLKMSRNEWEQILDIDLHGIFHCTRAVIGQMMEQTDDLFPSPPRVNSHENQRFSGSTDRVAQALLDPPLSDLGFVSGGGY